MTGVSILLFVIAFGTIITLHELGHFLTAKMFKVYCTDFSIGFGYKILKIGRKENGNRPKSLFFIERKSPKAETTFNIGIIPLGGYVSMVGENDDESLKNYPGAKGRSIDDVHYLKKLLIVCAGVIMNFILAFVIFFVSASCFPQFVNEGASVITINNSDEVAHSLTNDEEGLFPFEISDVEKNEEGVLEHFYLLDLSDTIYNKVTGNKDNQLVGFFVVNIENPIKVNNSKNNYCLILDANNFNLNNTDYSTTFVLALAESYENNEGQIVWQPILENGSFVKYTLSENDVISPIKMNIIEATLKDPKDMVEGESKYNLNFQSCYLKLKNNGGKIANLGFGVFIYEVKYSLLESLKYAGNMWVRATSVIGNAVKMLFTDIATWKQLGGPIALFTATNNIFTNNPFYVYLNVWGVLSVNVAIFNLLPFPGLDGWQIIVTLLEWIVNGFKKIGKKKEEPQDDGLVVELNVGEKKVEENKGWRVPKKVKNVIQTIGIILLFILMGLIFIKDIGGLF